MDLDRSLLSRRNPWRPVSQRPAGAASFAPGNPVDPGAATALEDLCGDYWFPLYAFVRRHGVSPNEAADIVQGLLCDLIERGDMAASTSQKADSAPSCGPPASTTWPTVATMIGPANALENSRSCRSTGSTLRAVTIANRTMS